MKTVLLPLICSLIIIPFFSNGQIQIEDSSVVKTDTSLYAIAVTKNQTLVYEHYFNQKSATELFNDQSLTKGIVSILIGIAIDKGFISSSGLFTVLAGVASIISSFLPCNPLSL